MKKFIYKHRIAITLTSFLILLYALIPTPKFNENYSTVIYSKNNKLLGARIAADEQWRFPINNSIPIKFTSALITFEDKYFNYHIGFNPISIVRASIQNTKAKKVISGGSTISMQLVRLARKGKARNIKEKLIELVLATKLELKYSKKEILALYSAYAPFGGNVVGLEAAAWRYYGRAPQNLSWAESATLAVLPNAPSLIYPGRNQNALKNKRNRLLLKLHAQKYIDTLNYQLALKEKLPQKPKKLPNIAPHLLSRNVKTDAGKKIQTTINYNLQKNCNSIIAKHIKSLKANEIYNAAALVINNETAKVSVYIGNSVNDKNHGNSVDIIHSARSSGSILKPLLFAGLINDGEILQNTLVPDIPLYMEGFAPKNYNLSYDGAVSATQALSRSLNIPAVHMLSKYSVPRFHNLLQTLNLSTISKSPDHYGLSLILGGAEVKLWDLAAVYSGMARTLTHCVEREYIYSSTDFCPLNYNINAVKKHDEDFSEHPFTLSAAAIWSTFEALQKVNRPNNQIGWKSFTSSKQIAWKTGTSYGFRDAWAIGVSPKYTVAIWVGNADGEGRPGLTGVTAAAPIMFDIFALLKPKGWFQKPFDEFVTADVCKQSGFLAMPNCPETNSDEILNTGLRTEPCPYHKIIHLDKSEKYRVNSSCYNPEETIHKSWFVLPPAMEYYFKKCNPFYLALPPLMHGCLNHETNNIMEFVYPRDATKIYIPVDNYGKRVETVFEVAHRNEKQKLFWHMDNEFLQSTSEYHQISVCPSLGKHNITVVDTKGNSIKKQFEIVSR